MQMARSVRRFLEALLRRTSFWVGSALFVFPIVEYFVPHRIMSEMAKVWLLENDIWLTFVGALLLLWAAFREWDELRELAVKLLREAWASPGGDGQTESPSLLPDALRDEIAKLRLQLTQQEGRQLTSEQRAALVAALKESDEPIHINIVYNHLDAEAESYAAQLSAVLLPLRLAGQPFPVSDIPDGLDGVVIRVNGGLVPHFAQRLSGALTKAKINHRIEPLTGERAALVPPDYCDLAIG